MADKWPCGTGGLWPVGGPHVAECSGLVTRGQSVSEERNRRKSNVQSYDSTRPLAGAAVV